MDAALASAVQSPDASTVHGTVAVDSCGLVVASSDASSAAAGPFAHALLDGAAALAPEDDENAGAPTVAVYTEAATVVIGAKDETTVAVWTNPQ